MKEWFKYKHGYVNVDDSNVYLTRSGNWSETEGLSRTPDKTGATHQRKQLPIILFLLINIAVVAILIVYKLSVAWLAPVLAIYLAIRFLSPNNGPCYYIPHADLLSVEDTNKGLRLSFNDPKGKQAEQLLPKADAKGKAILQAILAGRH